MDDRLKVVLPKAVASLKEQFHQVIRIDFQRVGVNSRFVLVENDWKIDRKIDRRYRCDCTVA